ncbi:hypothetical protein VMCG_00161 [Cytospora schulzeri]|uniref:DUF2306 domain-containing protein n=1 Tax=Cytospora schulzeri TaxID=448051 RepID=A0A423X8V5_9PEZI|nr:hypothetical protein VMCG_00161 [Valsa malicola]
MTTSIYFRAPTALASLWRGLQHFVGFQKGYNFVLWSVFAFALLGFALSHSPYLNYYGIFCRQGYLKASSHAAPGECYYFLNGGREQVGMMIHIFAIIPCCFLVFLQFVPFIRQRYALFHRANGYIIILLMSIAMAGGLMAARRSFGGDPAFQASNVLLTSLVVVGLSLAMISIKRLQIEQHRAWMLRTWFWAFSVITMRIIQAAASRIVSNKGYTAMRPCAQIDSDGVLPAAMIQQSWPGCAAYFSGENPGQQVLVDANYYGLPIEINVALSIASGVSALLSLFLHALGVEIYVSNHKQLAAGIRFPGRSGLAVDRLAYATKWSPRADEKSDIDVTPRCSSDEEARE